MQTIALLHYGCTAFMAGIVWYAQIAHYPLFAAVPATSFPDYQRRNIARTACLVVPAMAVEAATALWLLWNLRTTAAAAAATLLLGVWGLTAAHWTQHRALAQSFSEERHRRLLTLHWVRVAAWTARSILAATMAA